MADHINLSLRGIWFLAEGQRTTRRRTMIKPAAAAAAAIPYSHVRDGGEKQKKKKKKKKKKRLRKDELLEEEKDGYEVPSDIWLEILSRLPLESRMLARFVCRAWNTILTLTRHHHPTLTPASILYTAYEKPSYRGTGSFCPARLTLVYPTEGSDLFSTFIDVPDPCTHLPLIDDDEGFARDEILIPIASCHGLVCFLPSSEERHQIFVGNPLLMEELLLVPSSDTTKTHIHTEEEDVSVFEDIVGFGFSPKTNRYKIMQYVSFCKFVEPHREYQEYFNICTLCNTNHEESPLWRSILNFPRQFREGIDRKLLGSYLKGGIHWLLWDEDGDYVFISRLDLDTEQFRRFQAPQTSDFNTADKCLKDMCLGVSDGYLNICANLCSDEVDVWVMKEHYSWTKQFVVANPSTILRSFYPRIEILNYAAVEDATRRGAVAEVMLLYANIFFLACTTKGGHLRELDTPPGNFNAIVHIPSFLSIKNATKM